MKKIKFFVCLLIVSALLLPYTAFAAENASYGYGEGIMRDPFKSEEDAGFSLSAAASPITPEEKELLLYLTSKIPELNSTIEIPEKYRLSENRFRELYTYYMGSLLQFEHPEIFYLEDRFGYSVMQDDRHTVTALNIFFKPEYADGYSANVPKINEAQKIINDEINGIISECSGMSDLEKALYVHDYIAANYEYDTRVYSDEEGVDGNRTLDKMVEEKTGVCQGYTYLYMTAMKQLGIECIAVPSDELHHVWNKVKLGGEWYNVDVTYDDPISSNIISVSHNYFLVNDNEIKALDPSYITYDEYYQVDPLGNVLTDATGNPITTTVPTENSCHIVWNETNWDGTPSAVSSDSKYSYSPLHSIQGPTAYSGGSFYCFDPYNSLCEIIFENNQQILRERYVLSRDYKWFVTGQHSRYYTDSTGIPFYSSTVAEYNGRVYFNSPNTVYEFDTSNYTTKEIYRFDGTPDASETYLYGLRHYDQGLYAEYSSEPFGEVTLIDIPITNSPAPSEQPTPTPTTKPTPMPTTVPTPEPTAEPSPEVFPEFDEPLPVEKPTVLQAEITSVDTDENTGEEITSYEVTLSVDIPEEVHEAANEAAKPVTVSVAKYNEFGGFIGFEIVEVDENNKAKFEADSTCDMFKTFIWAGFIMPLSEAGEYQLNPTAE